MSANKKKDTEESSLNRVLNIKTSNRVLKQLQNELKSGIKEVWDERPDFIITTETSAIGIEHFLVDTLAKGKASTARKQVKQIEKLFNEYSDIPNSHDRERTKEAGVGAYKIALDTLNAKADFDYLAFDKEFKRIIDNHTSSIEAYKKSLLKFGKDFKIYFLIEITYENNSIWKVCNVNKNLAIANNKHNRSYLQPKVSKNGKLKDVLNWHEQSIKGIPITYSMIDYISELKDIDCVILEIHPIYDAAKSVVYALHPDQIQNDIKGQGIYLCTQFDYNIPKGTQFSVGDSVAHDEGIDIRVDVKTTC